MKTPPKKLVIYQSKDGAIAFRGDFEHEESVVWGSLNQIAQLFGRDKSGYLASHPKYIQKRWIRQSGNCCKNCNSSKRGKKKGDARDWVLQSRCHFICRLPRGLKSGDCVQKMGNQNSHTTPHQGLHHQQKDAQAQLSRVFARSGRHQIFGER